MIFWQNLEYHNESRFSSDWPLSYLFFFWPDKKSRSSVDQNEGSTIACRSTRSTFVFKEHCFFCGWPVKYEGRKWGYYVIPVHCTKDFEGKIQETCKVRNDKWVKTVLGIRVCTRSTCCRRCEQPSKDVNFRTGKRFWRSMRMILIQSVQRDVLRIQLNLTRS